MLLDLKRRAQPRGEQICRSRIENVIDRDFIHGAACEQPCDVFPLTARHTFQGEDRGAVADLLHTWIEEIVAQLGQKKAVANAVKKALGRWHWSKLREWLTLVRRWLIATIYSNHAFGPSNQKMCLSWFFDPAIDWRLSR
jgi:hypothetical protein